MDDPFRASVEGYALGLLEAEEGGALEAHLASCPGCAGLLRSCREVLRALAAGQRQAPDPELRGHVLELARAPREPLDLAAYDWQELEPGVRIHVMEDDPARGLRAVLVWARPGARMPAHRHLGDEEILVLRGGLRDHRAEYGPGDVCRSRTGSVHSEEVVPGGDCVCYVVYHGGHEPVGE